MEDANGKLAQGPAEDGAARLSSWREHCAAGKRAYENARYGDAARDYEAALREAESFGFKDGRFAATLNQLARAYGAAGRYNEAEPLFASALGLRQARFGPESVEAAQTLNELAALYAAAGKYDDAEKTYRRSLKIQERSRGAEDISLCPTLNNLALLYRKENRFEEALSLFQRALRAGLRGLGSEHPFVATSLNNLGAICVSLGKHSEAEAFFRQALAIKEKSLGPRHPEAATVLNNLAELYCVQDRLSEARPLYERVIRIDEAVLGPDHPEIAAGLVPLASVCEAAGDAGEAERCYRRALEIRERSLGPAHPLTLKTRDRLAELRSRHGRGEEPAAPIATPPAPGVVVTQVAPHNDEAILTPGGTEAIEEEEAVEPAAATASQDEKEIATEREPRVLVMTAAEPGLDRPEAAQSLCELADRAVQDGRWTDAERLYERELEIEQSRKGGGDPAVAATLNNLGLMRRAQGKLNEAAECLQASLSVFLESQSHSQVAVVLNNLAALYADRERYREAATLCRKSAEIEGSVHADRDDGRLALITDNLAAFRDSPAV